MRIKIQFAGIVLMLLLVTLHLSGQPNTTAKIAVIQATGLPNQDPFMNNYNPAKVRPQMMAHFNKLLGLFEKAGQMGADLVCGPEDMQHIGSYGLYIVLKIRRRGKYSLTDLLLRYQVP